MPPSRRNTWDQPASTRAVSCENCRKRKMKCSRSWPCGSCEMRGEECQYRDGVHPTMINSDPELESAQKEVRRLRALVDMLMARLMDSSSTPSHGTLAEDLANEFASNARGYGVEGYNPASSCFGPSSLGPGPGPSSAHYTALQSHTFRHLPYPSPTSAGFYAPRSVTSSSSLSDETFSTACGGPVGGPHGNPVDWLIAHGGINNHLNNGEHSSVVDAYLNQAVYGGGGQGGESNVHKDGDILVQSPAVRERPGEAYHAGRYY